MNLDAVTQAAEQGFSELLNRFQFWQLVPFAEKPSASSTIFDSKTGFQSISADVLSAFIAKNPYAKVLNSNGDFFAVVDFSTKKMWVEDLSQKFSNNKAASKAVKIKTYGGFGGWVLPSASELNFNSGFKKSCKYAGFMLSSPFFSQDQVEPCNVSVNPVASGSGFSSVATMVAGLSASPGFFSSSASSANNYSAFVFAKFSGWSVLTPAEIAVDIFKRGLSLSRIDGSDLVGADDVCVNLKPYELILAMANVGLKLHACDSEFVLDPRDFLFQRWLAKLDYTPCRLPLIDSLLLSDPDKGLWELWGESEESLKKHNVVARNPGLDIRDSAVAIDFGTSSTVVAINTPHGDRELLRIGARDFYAAIEPQHFENPTVLECVDFEKFESAWVEQAYRPPLDWNWMRAAHEAQANFRDNPGQTEILASILTRLKQWALRSERTRVRLTDRQGTEIEVPAHTERNPVRGQPLVTSRESFDPIELYAWYLGMAINWRGRGIFLKYYLSFPVKYERAVKDRILASFRRGLQRSLPATLISSKPEVLNSFEVSDLASEPAAYAAAALPHLGVQPTDEGVPYAVFDFGGGTTDYDYGLLRWANADEEDQGFERVFEHLGSSGDIYLGGENLVEHLVYASFQNNLSELRSKRIQFTKPIDARPFAGSESFLAATQAAQTNVVMLANKLRPFMEADELRLESDLKLDLINSSGEKSTCTLALDAEALDRLLLDRIKGGVQSFLIGLAQHRSDLPAGAPVHVLLAGNGSRSRYVKSMFDAESSAWQELVSEAFGAAAPEIVIHAPLPMDDANPHAPTAKTGVALGLLRLAPEENTLLVNRTAGIHEGEAPFGWFVGRLRRGLFDPVLTPGTPYGIWLELGRLHEGAFNLYSSASLRSRAGLQEGDPHLRKERKAFAAADKGAKIFARAIGPHQIELLASIEEPDSAASHGMIVLLG